MMCNICIILYIVWKNKLLVFLKITCFLQDSGGRIWQGEIQGFDTPVGASGVTLHVGAHPHRQRPPFGAPPPLKVEGKIEQIKLF